MRRLPGLLLVLFISFWAVGADADIYSWVDADGVRHFTNTPPPDNTPGVTSSREQAHDPVADQHRSVMDRRTMRRIYEARRAASEKKEKEKTEAKVEAGAESDPAESAPEKETKPRKKTLAQKMRSRAAAHKGSE